MKDRIAALVTHPHDAEQVPLQHGGFHLLADAHHTGGTLGATRLTLGEGRDGARPHHHALSAEAFYVAAGTVEFFLDGTVTAVAAGGLVVVPPWLPHAFGAAPGSPAEIVSLLTPGVERFGYFRSLGRIQQGLETFDDLLPEQDRYDVHFHDIPDWRRAPREP